MARNQTTGQARNTQTKPKPVKHGEFKVVNIDEIRVDPALNNRRGIETKEGVTYERKGKEGESTVSSLAKSIQKHGLLEPLTVRAIEDNDYSYELVAGFRRMEALKKNKRGTVPVFVVEAEDYPQISSLNLVENLQRENLSTAEQADAFHHLHHEENWSFSEIANQTGISRSYVNKLVTIRSNLHPDIVEAWHQGHEKATAMRLYDFATRFTQAEQKDTWDVQIGAKSGDEGGESSGNERSNARANGEGQDQPKRISKKKAEQALQATKEHRRDGTKYSDDYLKGIIAALNYDLGYREKPPVSMQQSDGEE